MRSRERRCAFDVEGAHGVNMNSEINALMNIIKSKNVEIKALRETSRAQDSINLILSAYIAIMTEKKGKTVIAKKTVSEALGKYLVNAVSEGDDYVITVVVSDGCTSVDTEKSEAERGSE